MLISKYCASGNDFVIFHTFNNVSNFNKSEFAIKVCNRHYGIGADGLVILTPSNINNVAYIWEFYNSDGSVANMCGNASRAVSLYAYLNKLAYSKHSFLSGAGVIDTEIIELKNNSSAIIKSKLGQFKVLGHFVEERQMSVFEFDLIDMTIPHLVCKTGSLKEYRTLTKDIEFLSVLRHKYNANINIAYKNGDENKIYYSTFERGVEGITQACGTGACAVFVAFNELDKKFILVPPSKEELIVECLNGDVYFSGLTHRIFECHYQYNN